MSQARRRKTTQAPARELPSWLLPGSVVALMAGVLIAAGWHWLPRVEGPAFETLVIKGERHQLSAEVLRDRVRPILDDGYFGADLAELRRELEAEPWVAAVSVRRQWPSTLALTVHEQVPAAVWNREGFLNEDGEFFVPREIHQEPGFLPELSGPEGSEAEVLEAWQAMQAELAPHGESAVALRLSERRAWTLELASGPELRLGRADRERRFERFAQVALPALARTERVAMASLDYIDMRYTNGFSVAPSGGDTTEDQGNG
ncbi:cell division protein FtsQ/DivIB [Gammaproteobacteria bacterium AB-CW1]|uniref:Cell division protein FtsQ n=1 Tax=Natronospira elongata TaxID=3110268 RepID=A0AAP6MM44_9GAMM|nr:cell division protein FtsQ/DivIB [Gammaproteobacteria bacterium AB-CW1]